VDYEGSESEEEEDVETTVTEMCLNDNKNNDIPVEGSVGTTQFDNSPGGHVVDKCLINKERNDIPDQVSLGSPGGHNVDKGLICQEKNDVTDEISLGANKTDIRERGHCEQTTIGNKDIEVDKCFNGRETNDSPVEGTVGENQADIGLGGSPSVADQSMENDQPTNVLVIESQMLHGIIILEKGDMGLTLLKTDQGYLVVKSIDKKNRRIKWTETWRCLVLSRDKW